MTFLDTPLSQQEFSNEVDLLNGCINRICVTDSFFELCRYYSIAIERLSTILESRFAELKEDRR